MGFFLVMKAEIVRSWIITRRYWFRTVTGMILSYGMLLVLVLGFLFSQGDTSKDPNVPANGDPSAASTPAAPQGQGILNIVSQDSEKATNYILGFIIGIFAFGVVGMFSQGLQDMARSGVLEQLCMSPHGLIVNFLARCFVGSVMSILSSSIMVWMVTETVGGILHFSFWPVLTLLALTFCNLLGFGFVVGGLVLVFKQVGQVAVLLRIVLFALAVLANEDLLTRGWYIAGIMHALPITDAAICLKEVLIQDAGSAVFVHPCFYWLMASCVFWTSLGIGLFKFFEDWSRAKGTLGAY